MTQLSPAPAPAPPTARRSLTTGTIVATLALAVLLAAAWFWSNLLLMSFAAILIAIALRAGARGLNRLLGLNVKLGVLVVLLGVMAVLACWCGWPDRPSGTSSVSWPTPCPARGRPSRTGRHRGPSPTR